MEHRELLIGSRNDLSSQDQIYRLATLTIQTCEQEILNLEVEMEKHYMAVRVLQAKKAKEMEKIRKAQASFTLARRLPLELFGKIFLACVQDNPHSLVAMTVSHVCTTWRLAALNTPLLWSYIHADGGRIPSSDPVARVKHWIAHSGHTGLHVSFDIGHDSTGVPAILHALDPHLSRWLSLKMRVENEVYANVVFLNLLNAATSLQEIDIDILGDLASEDEPHLTFMPLRNAFSDSQSLRTLRLTSNVVPHPSVLPSSLQTLELTHANRFDRPLLISSLLELLEGHSRLEIFHLTVLYGVEVPDDVQTDQIIALENLCSLSLTVFPNCCDILRHLACPNLLSLAVRNPYTNTLVTLTEDEEMFGNLLCQFLEQSAAPLQSLQLHDFYLTSQQFIRCFESIPSLEVLRLHDTDIEDEVINEVQRRAGDPDGSLPQMLMQLHTLDLRWDGRISGKVLVELLESRGTSYDSDGIQRGFKELTVMNCSHLQEEDVIKISSMTTCKLYARPGDFCYALDSHGCCNNTRYRRRMRLRHAATLSPAHRKHLHF